MNEKQRERERRNEKKRAERKYHVSPSFLVVLVVENLISIPSIQQLYRSLIFDKG